MGDGFGLKLGVVGIILLLLGGCGAQQTDSPPIEVKLYQKWQLQPGDTIAGYKVTGGLGDIAIDLQGKRVYAPFSGEAQINRQGCVFFSTPNVPAYLFRLCGLKSPKLGLLEQGAAIGSGDTLQFATLRKQPNGTWAIVEPSKEMLERMLKAP